MKHIMLYLLYYAMISFEHTMLQYLRNYEEVKKASITTVWFFAQKACKFTLHAKFIDFHVL